MSSGAATANADVAKQNMSAVETKDEKASIRETATMDNLVYDKADVEPTFHARTYLALGSMFFLNMVQVFALQGPPLVLTTIGADLNATESETWVPNALSVVQAALAPVIASASDIFEARKFILVGLTAVSFVGAAIAPGSKDISRLIAAQVLIGFGFSAVPLAYCIPSEILPRKWRPMAQSFINIAAVFGACSGPLIIGALTRNDPVNGWRKFYWIQMALWGVSSIGILLGYRPPKRHTTLDTLPILQKIRQLDLFGFFLFTAGLCLFLTGMNLGGGLYKWNSPTVLATLVIGLITLLGFAGYEWKGTSHGLLNHAFFHGGKEGGRSFAICVGLIFIEGIMLFSVIIFYPILTSSLFETDPFLIAAREQSFWFSSGVSTLVWGFLSTKFRTIRTTLAAAFVLFTAGIAALASIQPGDSTKAIVFSGLAGVGFGGPLILIIAGVQLSTPDHLIATATSITTASRAVGATVFTAIFSAAYRSRITAKLPAYVAAAALEAGLPKQSLEAFIEALVANQSTALDKVSGVTPAIIANAVQAIKQAQADSLRVVYIIAAPFGILAIVGCFFLSSLGKTMNYRVDHPMEDLRAKHESTKDAMDSA